MRTVVGKDSAGAAGTGGSTAPPAATTSPGRTPTPRALNAERRKRPRKRKVAAMPRTPKGSSFVAGGEGSAPPPVTRQQISPSLLPQARAAGGAADQSRKSSVQSTALPPNWPRLPRPDRRSSGEPQHPATPSTSGRLHPPTMPRPLPNPSAKRSRAGSKRRAAGWMLLTLGLLIAGVWLASAWWSVKYFCDPFPFERVIEVRRGGVAIDFERDPVGCDPFPGGWSVYPLHPAAVGLDWGARGMNEHGGWLAFYKPMGGRRVTDLGGYYSVSSPGLNSNTRIVLWPLPLMLWTTGGLALWSGRRARWRAMINHCPTCGYNLAGLVPGAQCPECGR